MSAIDMFTESVELAESSIDWFLYFTYKKNMSWAEWSAKQMLPKNTFGYKVNIQYCKR